MSDLSGSQLGIALRFRILGNQRRRSRFRGTRRTAGSMLLDENGQAITIDGFD
jgi:hypothetical protein